LSNYRLEGIAPHNTDREDSGMVGVRHTICHWATNRTDPQNLLSTTLDVPLQPSHKKHSKEEKGHKEEVQYTSYDRKCRNIVGKAFQVRHAY